jgi:hypothetical protein
VRKLVSVLRHLELLDWLGKDIPKALMVSVKS